MTSRILIVDDQALVRNHFQRTLEKENYEITIAEHGREGLELAQKEAFDLIFTDLNMPFVSGLEMIKSIRGGSGPNKDTKIVMVSSDAAMSSKLKAKEIGASGWITKPIEGEKLLQQTKQLLQLKS